MFAEYFGQFAASGAKSLSQALIKLLCLAVACKQIMIIMISMNKLLRRNLGVYLY